MIDALRGVTFSLLCLSSGYLFFVIRYQIMTRGDDVDQTTSMYKWVVSLGAMAVFVLSLLFFLNDWDILFKSQQRDIGIIWRTLFAVQLAFALIILKWPFGRKLVSFSIAAGIVVFVAGRIF